ncbi:MAG: hypothetical protein RL322_1670 [Pseudomonadota bacterium]|jgi:molybdopterin synthase sulfur carrier subunit
MTIRIRYFAALRESFGIEEESIERPEGVETVAALRRWLCAREGVWAEQLAEHRPVRVAVRQRMVNGDALLEDDVELAFFPPVTGG